MPVERASIAPPRCRIGAITAEERAQVRGRSPVGAKYDTRVNRESAYEMLGKRAVGQENTPPQGTVAPRKSEEQQGSVFSDILWGSKRRQGLVEAMAKQAARTVGSEVGRQVIRGVLGTIFGGTRRR